MFIDRQKLERVHLDELTKIGNLFDTLEIDYCVAGSYALLSYGIISKAKTDCVVLVFTEKRDKIVEMLFKLNYTIIRIEKNLIKISKEDPAGTIQMDLLFGSKDEKNIIFHIMAKNIILDGKFFVQNRKEVKTKKGSKGYFRTAPLELIYFIKMNDNDPAVALDLEVIKGSSKLDIDGLLVLFKINGLI